MKKEIWILIFLAVIIVILLAFFIFMPAPTKNNPPQSTPIPVAQTGIVITSPKPNEEVSLPIKITGVVNGNGWVGFEGQVGTVRLLDSEGNELALGILAATTEWTKLPTNFETTLNFVAANSGPATLVFHNENPSGDPAKDKTFTLPVKVSVASAETMPVKVYFQSTQSNIDCNYVVAAERTIAKTLAPARAALEELLKGFTAEERQIYMTSINTGVKIQSLTIENGTAKVDFDEQLEKGVAGSCRVAAIRAQITKTLEQFSTIKNVIISINGRTADILQP